METEPVKSGEFTTAKGKVQKCVFIGESRLALLKVRYTKRGQSYVLWIERHQFRPS